MLGVTFLKINTVPLFRTLQNGANQSTVTLKYQIKVTESVCSNTVMAILLLQGINLVAKNFLEYSSFVCFCKFRERCEFHSNYKNSGASVMKTGTKVA